MKSDFANFDNLISSGGVAQHKTDNETAVKKCGRLGEPCFKAGDNKAESAIKRPEREPSFKMRSQG